MDIGIDMGREINISDADLCAVFSNLLENALEACNRQRDENRFISFHVKQTDSALSIRMENSTDGNIAARGGAIMSSKAVGRKGYGLESIKEIAKRYRGVADFAYDNEKRVFRCTVLLMF